MFVYRTAGYWSTDFSTIRPQFSCSLPIFATVAREILRRVRTTTLGSKVLTRFIARHSWSMQGRNNQNRKQIRAIFEHVKDFANCYSPVLKLTIANNMGLSYLAVYFQAAAFSGTSIKDHGNSQSGNSNIRRESTAEQREGWQVPVPCQNSKFSSFWHGMYSHDFTHSLSPQLLFAVFSRWKAPCVLPGFLFAPPTFAARLSDVPTSAEANTIDMGSSPQCRH